jgi:hypothetical protein
MSSNVRTATTTDSVNDVMDLMGREQIRRVPSSMTAARCRRHPQADIVLEAKDNKRAEKTVEQIRNRRGNTRSSGIAVPPDEQHDDSEPRRRTNLRLGR